MLCFMSMSRRSWFFQVGAASLLLVGVTTSLHAGNIAKNAEESVVNLSFNVMHGDIAANAVHNFADLFTGADWKLTKKITETDAAAGDKFEIDCELQHLKRVPGHGAGEAQPNPNTLSLTGTIQAGGGAGRVGAGIHPFGGSIVKKHTEHFDIIQLNGHVGVAANDKDIVSYQMAISASHKQTEPKGGKGKIEVITPSLVNGGGVPPDAYGSCAWMVDPSSGSLNVSIAVSGLPAALVTAARIRLGSPGAPGGIVFSFSPGFFTPMIDELLNELGSSAFVFDAPFPVGNVSDLLAENTFVEIVTPGGSLGGVLEVVDSVFGDLTSYMLSMDGIQVVPGPGDPDGAASGTITFDDEAGLISWDLDYANIAPPTSLHIHTGIMGQAGTVFIPLNVGGSPGVLTGSISHTPADITALLLDPDNFYVDIHNSNFPLGAVRGQLGVLVSIPAVSTLGLIVTAILLCAAAGIVVVLRRRPQTSELR